MTLKSHTPTGIRAPFARYSHGIEIPPHARLMVCSGQLGIAPDDEIPEDVADQTRLCFENIRAILVSADMDLGDIVRINAYVTDRAHLPCYMAARDEFIGTPPPASTLMIVTGFAREDFKVEVEVLAARVDDDRT